MTGLQRRYRRLLRAYPAWYRRQRGEEMLTTLLEASPPGRGWPSPRDARALIMGGLRVRAGQNRRLGTATNVRLAVLLGAALALLWLISDSLSVDIQTLVWPDPAAAYPGLGYWLASDVLALAAVAAAWFAPRPVAVVIALAAAAAWEYGGDRIMAIQPAGLLILLAILVSGRERLPRSWLWLAGPIFAANLLDRFTGIHLLFAVHDIIDGPLTLVPWIILGAMVAWAVVDARPAIAMAIWLASGYLVPNLLDSVDGQQGFTPAHWYVPTAGAAVLAAAATWRLRRQAAL